MNPQLKLRLKQLFYGLLGLKQFWAFVSTVLLWCGKIPAEIWSIVIMFVLGARSVEKIKDVSYRAEKQEE